MSTQDTTAEVGIIGVGRLGQAMARTVLRAGRQVVLAKQPRPGDAGVGGLDAG